MKVISLIFIILFITSCSSKIHLQQNKTILPNEENIFLDKCLEIFRDKYLPELRISRFKYTGVLSSNGYITKYQNCYIGMLSSDEIKKFNHTQNINNDNIEYNIFFNKNVKISKNHLCIYKPIDIGDKKILLIELREKEVIYTYLFMLKHEDLTYCKGSIVW